MKDPHSAQERFQATKDGILSNPHFYVITGASGAGKSTLLNALGELGHSVVPEIALAIVQEQERNGGSLFPWTHRQSFMEEVLARNIQAYDAAQALPSPVFFDRGIPECLAHMRLLGLETRPEHEGDLRQRRYANIVFVAQPWPEIYVCDRWRRATFDRAARSFEPTVSAYTDWGYRTQVIPQVSVAERVAFILRQIETSLAKGDEP
ncbi:MAG TPA: AAA family ATPase [Stenotrophomonas sp.]|jgi:predicted ATPase